MSGPNAQTKKHQMMLTGGVVTDILGLAGVDMFLFDSGSAQHYEKLKTVGTTTPGTVDDKGAWHAQQAAKEKSNEALIRGVKIQLKAQERQSKKFARALGGLKANKAIAGSVDSATAAKPDASVLDKPLPTGNSTGPGQHVLQPPNGKGGAIILNQSLSQVDVPARRGVGIITFNNTEGKGTAGAAIGGVDGITEALDFPADERAKRYGTASGGAGSGKQIIEFLSTGSFVRMAMLNDVGAPAGGQAQSNPLPVAFHVLNVANLANKHKLDIKGCHIVAVTWGDLSSERTMDRTETLACVINGEAVEMAIKGQMIGEDDKAGIQSRPVTKQGQLLTNALSADVLSGIGEAFQSSAAIIDTGDGDITQTIGPDKIGQATTGGGVSNAGQQLARYYLKTTNELYPVIETDSDRTVEILIAKDAVYSGRALAKNDYRGLLKRTGTNSRRYEDD